MSSPPSPPGATLFRPSVVSSFSSRSAASWKVRALHIGSYAAALGVVVVMVGFETYPVGASGLHALSGVQEGLRSTYEYAMTGEWPEAPPERRRRGEAAAVTVSASADSSPAPQAPR